MNDQGLLEALAGFLAHPDRSSLDGFLSNAGSFVIAQAKAWRDSKMPLVDRCREILSEIFLIMMEDFLPHRVAQPASVLSYLSLRLRRMTRPKCGRTIPFGLPPDLPETGRCGFTLFRLEMIAEIVRAVRETHAFEPHPETKSLEFLFLHVSPDLAWASRFLEAQAGHDSSPRLEADKKRHQSFNRSVRRRLEGIQIGDWRDVNQWSPGERSHLAWKIIGLSPFESGSLTGAEIETLENWRETWEKPTERDASLMELVRKGCRLFESLYRSGPASASVPDMAHEEAAPYGLTEEPDLLLSLLRPETLSVGGSLRETAAEWTTGKSRQGASGTQRGDPGLRPEDGNGGEGLANGFSPNSDPGDEAAFGAALREVKHWIDGFQGHDGRFMIGTSPREPASRRNTSYPGGR